MTFRMETTTPDELTISVENNDQKLNMENNLLQKE